MANKKNQHKIISVIIIVFIIAALIFYFSVFYATKNEFIDQSKTLKNPVEGLTNEQAIEKFNENFLLYLLYNIGANNLRNVAFTSDTPKIAIYIDEEFYSAEVIDKKITVQKKEIQNADILIITTKQEAVKMLRDKAYIRQSFIEGKSRLEPIVSKPKLIAKGYLKLYSRVSE